MRPSILMSSWAFNSPLKRSVGPNTDMRSLDALLINISWGVPDADAKRGIDCAASYAKNRVAGRRRGRSVSPTNNMENGDSPHLLAIGDCPRFHLRHQAERPSV